MNLQVISKVYCLSHGMELLHAINLQSTFIMHYALYNRLPREPEKCRIAQDILCRKKRLECSTRESHKARRRRDKQDGASEVSEEV